MVIYSVVRSSDSSNLFYADSEELCFKFLEGYGMAPVDGSEFWCYPGTSMASILAGRVYLYVSPITVCTGEEE